MPGHGVHVAQSWRPYRDHALGIARAALDAVLADRLRALPVDFARSVG